MDTLLRAIAVWKGRRRSAQVIVFDGGAEVETTRAFMRGVLSGVALAVIIFLLTAPTITDPAMVEDLRSRELLLRQANQRTEQAMGVAKICLDTAEQLDRTLGSYQTFLGGTK